MSHDELPLQGAQEWSRAWGPTRAQANLPIGQGAFGVAVRLHADETVELHQGGRQGGRVLVENAMRLDMGRLLRRCRSIRRGGRLPEAPTTSSPLRMSVWPVASHTLAPLGIGIAMPQDMKIMFS